MVAAGRVRGDPAFPLGLVAPRAVVRRPPDLWRLQPSPPDVSLAPPTPLSWAATPLQRPRIPL